MTAITAAVVGVILNLSIWFATHVFFDTVTQGQVGPARLPLPDPASLNPAAAGLALLAAGLLWRLKWSLPLVLLLMAVAGVAAARIV